MKRACVYIDGFNLYYGVRNTPYRWLNLSLLAHTLLPRCHVIGVKYFTAQVFSFPGDPAAPSRQQVYWRALSTLSDLEIIQGRFQIKPITLPLVSDSSRMATVMKSEEKGSDVNLASHLLLDAFKHEIDEAAVISGDSDLATPIQMVRGLGIDVRIFDPRPPERTCLDLKKVGSTYSHIYMSVYKKCQFPDSLTDAAGKTIQRPVEWNTGKNLNRIAPHSPT